jgi:hypothetical protein
VDSINRKNEFRAVIGALLEHLAAEGHGKTAQYWHQDICQTCSDMAKADKLLKETQ